MVLAHLLRCILSVGLDGHIIIRVSSLINSQILASLDKVALKVFNLSNIWPSEAIALSQSFGITLLIQGSLISVKLQGRLVSDLGFVILFNEEI